MTGGGGAVTARPSVSSQLLRLMHMSYLVANRCCP
jgi:hypothetical protein